MRGLGMLTVGALALAAAAAATVRVMSIPDIKRYFKIRQM